MDLDQRKREIKKYYVWIWVKNPWANDWNDKPEKELRRYRVKEFKKNCVILFNGKQYPYSQIVSQEEFWVKINQRSRDDTIAEYVGGMRKEENDA